MQKQDTKVPEITEEFNKLFPAIWLKNTARAVKAVVRERDVNIVTLFWTLVLAPTIGRGKHMVDYQRIFQCMSNISLVTSAFLGRFTKGLANLMKVCVIHLIEHVYVKSLTPAIFIPFKDVLSTDSTVLTLADVLAKIFPGTRKNTKPAALKVNAVYSVISSTVKKVQIAKETKSETKFVSIGKWVKEQLLLFDLGYYDFCLFYSIHTHGGYWISRLKSITNPIIEKDNIGNAIKFIGKQLSDIFECYHEDVIDVMVTVTLRRKKRNGKQSRVMKTMPTKMMIRVVGVWNKEKEKYYTYITNVDVDTLSAREVGSAYASRWVVETLFSELKHTFGMSGLPTTQKMAILILIYAAMIRMMLSRVALDNIRRKMLLEFMAKKKKVKDNIEELEFEINQRTPIMRFAAVFELFGIFLLPGVLAKAGIIWDPHLIEEQMMRAAIDPNVNRADSAFLRRFNA